MLSGRGRPMLDRIKDMLEGVSADDLIGIDTAEPFSIHPGQFIWVKLKEIFMNLDLEDLKDYVDSPENYSKLKFEGEDVVSDTLEDYVTRLDDTISTRLSDEEDSNKESSFDIETKLWSDNCNYLFQIMENFNRCEFRSKLFDLLSEDMQFLRLVMWLIMNCKESHHIYSTRFHTETEQYSVNIGDAVFIIEQLWDLGDDCDELNDILVEDLPSRSYFWRVKTKHYDNPVMEIVRKENIETLHYTSDKSLISDSIKDADLDVNDHEDIPVPESTHVPLTTNHFSLGLDTLRRLRLIQIDLMWNFVSGQRHPGSLLPVGGYGGGGYGGNQKEPPFTLPNGSYGMPQDEDFFLICLKISDGGDSISRILPDSLEHYLKHHRGMNIVISLYGRGMFKGFSDLLYHVLKSKNVLGHVEGVLHFRNNGEYITTSILDPDPEGWIVTDPDPRDRGGYYNI